MVVGERIISVIRYEEEEQEEDEMATTEASPRTSTPKSPKGHVESHDDEADATTLSRDSRSESNCNHVR